MHSQRASWVLWGCLFTLHSSHTHARTRTCTHTRTMTAKNDVLPLFCARSRRTSPRLRSRSHSAKKVSSRLPHSSSWRRSVSSGRTAWACGQTRRGLTQVCECKRHLRRARVCRDFFLSSFLSSLLFATSFFLLNFRSGNTE